MRLLAHFFARLIAACLFAAMATEFSGEALAEAQQIAPVQVAPSTLPVVKQITLTEKQIKGLLAASKDINDITDRAPESIDKLSPATVAQLDAVVRKNGLASYDEYKNIGENVGLVLGGVDPATNKYVGKEVWVNAKIARVRADKKMSDEDKKEALEDLYDNLQSPLPPVQYKGNIALVLKYLKELSAMMRGD